MNMTNKRAAVVTVVFFIITGISFGLCFIYDKRSRDIQSYVLEFETNDGWGYDVFYKNGLLIHQEYIPAIRGEITFQTREEALQVGRLVLERFQNGQQATITVQDLNRLKIVYPDGSKSP